MDNGRSIDSLVLNMSDEAEECFYNWYNDIIEKVNAVDDMAIESRLMKLNGNAARLSLVFQILKWATDEDDMQSINIDSVKSAIRMIDYYEKTYQRIQDILVANNIGDTKEAWLSLLGETFTAGEAITAGKKVEMSRRSVYYALEQLCRLQNPVIEKLQHGKYRKIVNPDAPCTIALSSEDNTTESTQSAKVQSANTEIKENHG